MTINFNLSSASCSAIHDFGALARIIDDTARAGRGDRVCISPVSDTVSTHTAADSNPYSVVSVYALHPLYCDLSRLAPITNPLERERLEMLSYGLDNPTEGHYYNVMLNAKHEYLYSVYRQEGERVRHSSDFRRFFADNERWLVPYAQYSYLRDAYGIADFRKWPSHNEWTEAERGALQNPRTKAYKKLSFIYYVQYVMRRQLEAIHDRAAKLGVELVGDMTANINPNGCDTWQSADVVGSDYWWTGRLKSMESFYDSCRVSASVMARLNPCESVDMHLETF